MELSVQNFFTTVLPQGGSYFAVARRGLADDFPRHKVCVNIDGIMAVPSVVTPMDYWFAPASYTQGYHEVIGRDGTPRKQFRTANNVAFLRS